MSGRSASTINHAIDAIRQFLDIAVDQGQLPPTRCIGGV